MAQRTQPRVIALNELVPVLSGNRPVTARQNSLIPPVMPDYMSADVSRNLEQSQPTFQEPAQPSQSDLILEQIAALQGQPIGYRQRQVQDPTRPNFQPAPEFDAQGMEQKAKGILDIAALAPIIGMLGGDSLYGATQGMRGASAALNGLQKGSRQSFEDDLGAVNNANALQQKNFEVGMDLANSDDRRVSNANSVMRQERNDRLDAMTTSYNVASRAEQKALDQAEKTRQFNENQKLEREKEERRKDHEKLSSIISLARTGMMSEDSIAEASKIMNRIMGTGGFDPNFISNLSERDRQRLVEMRLSREERKARETSRQMAQKALQDDRLRVQRDLQRESIEFKKSHDAFVAKSNKDLAMLRNQLRGVPNAGSALSAMRGLQGQLNSQSVTVRGEERQVQNAMDEITKLYKTKEFVDSGTESGLNETGEARLAALNMQMRMADKRRKDAAEAYTNTMNRLTQFSEATGAFDPRNYQPQQQQGQPQPQGNPNPPKGQQGKGGKTITTSSGVKVRVE